jgi:hypothetical protein
VITHKARSITLRTRTLRGPIYFCNPNTMYMEGGLAGRSSEKRIVYSLNDALGVSCASCIILNRNIILLSSANPPDSQVHDSLIEGSLRTKWLTASSQSKATSPPRRGNEDLELGEQDDRNPIRYCVCARNSDSLRVSTNRTKPHCSASKRIQVCG